MEYPNSRLVRTFESSQMVTALHKSSFEAVQDDLKHEIKMSGIPIAGFVLGSILLLTLFFTRIISVLAFVILPFTQAVAVSILLIFINYYVHHSPGITPGITMASPPTEIQYRIMSSLSPFVKYEPPWWFFDAHFTTLLPLLLNTLPPLPIMKQSLAASDGAPLGLDWYIPPGDIRGVVLTIPGLNGSSRGGYVVDQMMRMEKEGLAIAVLNGRGAGRTSVTSITSSFHLGRSSDLMTCIEGIEAITKRQLPIYIMGYSAGGMRAVNFAADFGSQLVGRVAGIVSFGGVVKDDATKEMRLSTAAYQPVIVHAYASTMYSKFAPLLTAAEGSSDDSKKIHDLFTKKFFYPLAVL